MGLLQVLHHGITVGEVAGIISGVTSLISITLPLFVALILVWSIKNLHLNASTWSTAANTLQGTIWPTVLRSDSARSDFVARQVAIASTTITCAVVLLLAVNIVTPLPLIEEIQAKKDSSSVSFSYAPDLTFFGKGTAARPAERMQRSCGTQIYSDCTPSDNLFEKLSSGTVGTTVAGPRNIQFRNFFFYQNQTVDLHNETIAVGMTRPMQYLLLNTDYTIIEGAIVDPINGGIGFRNHTVPIGLQLGATWQEDILWIQPETVCTANNFSIHFPFGNSHVNQLFPGLNTGVDPDDATDRYLQDDGAFAHRDWSILSPRWDIYGSDSVWNITGPVPDLMQRSFIAAWWDNYFTALALNITENSTTSIGDRYDKDFRDYTAITTPFSISIGNMDGAFLDQSWAYNLWVFVSANIDRFYDISGLIPGVEAAANFSSNFQKYGRRCFGFDDSDIPEPLKPYIRCGNLYGVGIPDDESESVFQVGSQVGQPVYTCASSVKAMIKTVEFSFNGTSSLKNVVISSISDKNYSSPEKYPVWGVEKVDPSQNLNISDISLLWGLVSDNYENDTEITTIRGKEFYLPVAYGSTDMSVFKDSLAAASAFTTAWNSVYQESAWVSGASFGGLPSYSGEIQYSLYLKWRELSRTSDGAAKILDLIWTDLVASAVVGTKTGFENSSPIQQPGVLGQRLVYKHHSVVTYSNLLFAIPAFIVLFLWVILLVFSIVLLISRKVTGDMLTYYINQSSLGRAVLQAEQPNPQMAMTSSKEWAREFGNQVIGILPYSQRASTLQLKGSTLPENSSAYQRSEEINQLADLEKVETDEKKQIWNVRIQKVGSEATELRMTEGKQGERKSETKMMKPRMLGRRNQC